MKIDMKNKIKKRNISEVEGVEIMNNGQKKKVFKSKLNANPGITDKRTKTNLTTLSPANNSIVSEKSKKTKKNKKNVKREKLNLEKSDSAAVTDSDDVQTNKISNDETPSKKKLKEIESKQIKREKRKQARKELGQFKIKDSMPTEEIRQKIAEIESRENITKTAKRKLRVYKKKLQIAEGTASLAPSKPLNVASKMTKHTESQKKNKQSITKENKNNKKAKFEEKSKQESDSSEDTSPVIVKNEEIKMDQSDSYTDESDRDDEKEDLGDSENDETTQEIQEPKFKNIEKNVVKKSPKNNDNTKKSNNSSQENSEKKKRYVLFVGNLSYESTVEDIKQHFLQKVSNVISVRIPTAPGSKKPRGFAYVEVTNSADYEKGLSLHNTNLKGFKIKVEYTQTGSKNIKNKQELVAKNKKLHALRKAGKLAGSSRKTIQRNFRRQLIKTKVQEE